MFIQRIITGGTIETIINGQSNGKERDYFIVEKPMTKLEKWAFFASNKMEQGFLPFLKVKYEWKLGLRARVLEVVTKKEQEITIYKFVNASNYDQHILDMERIKECVCNDGLIASEDIKICLVVTAPEQKARISSLIKEMGIECNVESL